MSNTLDSYSMADRLRQLEDETRQALVQRTRSTEPAIEIAPVARFVPVPRRARMFRRTGEGHGVFTDVTLTNPHRPAPA